MAEKKIVVDMTAPRQGGLVRETLNNIKLIFRLLGDKRVNFFTKLIPIGAFAYLIFPLDGDLVLPIIGLVDDAAVLWIGSYVFTELCPPDVVDEHRKALASATTINARDEIVDAESTDIKE